MKNKKRLSAVILTKNEENRVTQALDSVKNWSDEIVVIDDCSTDNTVEICRNYGAKVFVRPLNSDFASQRNFGIEKAGGEWILQLDTDEVIPHQTAIKIKEAISASSDFVAFELRRKNFFFGYPLRYGGAYNWGVKLFRKGKAYYIGSVHETLKIEGKIGRIGADIHHFPFSSIKDILNKMNFYTEIEAGLFIKNIDKISFKGIKYRLTWKSLKLFWKLYVKKKGYKDGMYGLAWSILNVIGPQIRWLKIWEKALRERKLT